MSILLNQGVSPIKRPDEGHAWSKPETTIKGDLEQQLGEIPFDGGATAPYGREYMLGQKKHHLPDLRP